MKFLSWSFRSRFFKVETSIDQQMIRHLQASPPKKLEKQITSKEPGGYFSGLGRGLLPTLVPTSVFSGFQVCTTKRSGDETLQREGNPVLSPASYRIASTRIMIVFCTFGVFCWAYRNLWICYEHLNIISWLTREYSRPSFWTMTQN